jgi:hypothetical protein
VAVVLFQAGIAGKEAKHARKNLAPAHPPPDSCHFKFQVLRDESGFVPRLGRFANLEALMIRSRYSHFVFDLLNIAGAPCICAGILPPEFNRASGVKGN